jgi:SAM-dependent methyltransferase
MNMFEEYFSGNKNFVFANGIYQQVGFGRDEFEKEYTDVRTREGRMYDDNVARYLPEIPADHVLYNEWKVRAYSARHFVSYLKFVRCKSIVEIGCGNGWLTTYIQDKMKIPACGIDVGKAELHQAARISRGKSVFVHGDVFSEALDGLRADVVLLASCVQYFSDLRSLIGRLKEIGSIHIIDSPVYDDGASAEAKARSAAYFHSMGSPGMEKFYYHHEKKDFRAFNAEFMYDPSGLFGRLTRRLTNSSPFPWIRIGK